MRQRLEEFAASRRTTSTAFWVRRVEGSLGRDHDDRPQFEEGAGEGY
jgi:hypothetical protein